MANFEAIDDDDKQMIKFHLNIEIDEDMKNQLYVCCGNKLTRYHMYDLMQKVMYLMQEKFNIVISPTDAFNKTVGCLLNSDNRHFFNGLCAYREIGNSKDSLKYYLESKYADKLLQAREKKLKQYQTERPEKNYTINDVYIYYADVWSKSDKALYEAIEKKENEILSLMAKDIINQAYHLKI